MIWIGFRVLVSGGFLTLSVAVAPKAAFLTLTVAGAGAVLAWASLDWLDR